MEELKLFNNPEFGTIRVISIEDEPWLVGKDVAEALGYSNTKDALATHVDDEDKRVIQRSENATLEERRKPPAVWSGACHFLAVMVSYMIRVLPINGKRCVLPSG